MGVFSDELSAGAENIIGKTKDKAKELVSEENLGKAKDTAENVLVTALDEILEPAGVDAAEAGIAFGFALVDGWTFGAAGGIINAISPETGAELRRIRQENKTISTAVRYSLLPISWYCCKILDSCDKVRS